MDQCPNKWGLRNGIGLHKYSGVRLLSKMSDQLSVGKSFPT